MATNAMSPFIDRIARLRQMGGQALDTVTAPIQHGVQSVESALGIPLAPDAHQQAIDQMNQQINAHNNDQANQSFRRAVPRR